MNIYLLEQTNALIELEAKKAEVDFEDNTFLTFHRALIKALKSSDDKVYTVSSFQKLLDFETAFIQFQLEYGIPYPDKTMGIVDEFLRSADKEGEKATGQEVMEMVKESAEDDDAEDDIVVTARGKLPVVAEGATTVKKSFFSFP
jgi:hypothetical protein